MKNIITAAAVLGMCLCMAGCSKANLVTGYKHGDVTLGQYRGITYTKLSTEVTDEEVEAAIADELESKAEKVEVTDRAVQSGDTVNIDFVGKVDGVEFDNGSATDQELEIGSGRMIPGFEDALIGFTTGETRTIEVTFPETYSNNPDMAGVDATFDITVNAIYENIIPELTEEFVTENYDYATVAEYRDSIRASLQAEAEENAEASKFNDVIDTAVNNATFNKDLTEDIQAAKDTLLNNYNAMAQSYYGVDAVTLFSAMYGWTEEQFNAAMETQAKANTQYNYLLSAIVDEEKITATDDEVNSYAESILADYSVSTVDELYSLLTTNSGKNGKSLITEQVKLNKASDLIVDTAIEGE